MFEFALMFDFNNSSVIFEEKYSILLISNARLMAKLSEFERISYIMAMVYTHEQDVL